MSEPNPDPDYQAFLANKERRESYFQALGRFVNAFAKAEAFTHMSFRFFAKFDAGLAMAVKGSIRLSDLMPIIKRVMVLNEFSEKDRREVEMLFNQLNEISVFRDRILHRGAEMLDDGTLQSTNHATMKAIENLEVVKFTVDNIEDATTDLNRIAMRLTMVTPREDDAPRDVLPEDFEKYLFEPWRYKPVKPENPHQPRQSKTRVRQRQRRPS